MATPTPPFLVWGRSVEAFGKLCLPNVATRGPAPAAADDDDAAKVPTPTPTPRADATYTSPLPPISSPSSFLPPLSPLPPLLLLGSLVATLVVAAAVPSPPRVASR